MQAFSRTLRRGVQLNARFGDAACRVTTSAASETPAASSVAPTRKDALPREFQVRTRWHHLPAGTQFRGLFILPEKRCCLSSSRLPSCVESCITSRLRGYCCRYIAGTQTERTSPSTKVTMLTSTGQCDGTIIFSSSACLHSLNN